MKIKISNPVKFLIIVVALYLIAFLINPIYTKFSFNSFLVSFLKIIPIIIFVFILLFFVNYFLKPQKFVKHLGRSSGIKGWFYVLFTGSFIPLGAPYIVFPLLGELKEKGMSNALLAAFLYIRNLQIIFLLIMLHYFGALFTAVVWFYVFIFSIISGILMGRLLD